MQAEIKCEDEEVVMTVVWDVEDKMREDGGAGGVVVM